MNTYLHCKYSKSNTHLCTGKENVFLEGRKEKGKERQGKKRYPQIIYKGLRNKAKNNHSSEGSLIFIIKQHNKSS